MDNEKMGQFISELRKSLQMTQIELAAKLNVSDKAVSKWERGLSFPDISLLSPLSDILGVTIPELLNGEKTSSEAINVEASVASALEYVGKAVKEKIKLTQGIWVAAFSILLLLGILVVSIVDVAISGTFTWSLIAISSIVFAWLVFFPAVKFGIKGIAGSFIALSLLIVPFLYALDYVINRFIESNAPIFHLGLRITPLSIVFLWVAFFLFKKLKTRKLLASAILVSLAVPLNFFVNFWVNKMLGEPWFSLQTIINTSATMVFAIILFIMDFVVQKNKRK